MPATATIPTWAIQDEDPVARTGRLLTHALLDEGVVGVADNSFKVAQDTGSNMQIKVGSGTIGDLAVIKGGASAAQATYIGQHQNATQTLSIAASHSTNDRIDRVIARIYDDEADSSGKSWMDIEVLTGTPAGSPVAPALPSGAISLATILVNNAVSAITNADITDLRTEATIKDAASSGGPLGVLGYAQVTANQGSITSEVDLTGLSVAVTVRAGRRIRVTGRVRFNNGTTDAQNIMRIKESTTVLQTATNNDHIDNFVLIDEVILTPSAGAHTYKLSGEAVTGTLTLNASSSAPAFILVEDIGPA